MKSFVVGWDCRAGRKGNDGEIRDGKMCHNGREEAGPQDLESRNNKTTEDFRFSELLYRLSQTDPVSSSVIPASKQQKLLAAWDLLLASRYIHIS